MLNGCHYPIHIMDSNVVFSLRPRRVRIALDRSSGQARALCRSEWGREANIEFIQLNVGMASMGICLCLPQQ